MTPVTAECTINTRAPLSRRARTTFAMLSQLASDDTLVPPNLRTIHAEGVRVTDFFLAAHAPRQLAEAVACSMLTWVGLGAEL